MNLQAITAGVVGAVNPATPVSWLQSTGYTTAADGTQSPAYAAAQTVSAQVQGLTAKDLKQLDGLNLQGLKRAFYVSANILGASSALGVGGDLLTFGADATPDVRGTTWLVVTVLETWGAGWCKVAAVLQPPAGAT